MSLTVGQLKAFLEAYPDDMEILETRHSDYSPMELDSWDTVIAINKYFYHMRVFKDQISGMKEEDLKYIKTYLHFKGN